MTISQAIRTPAPRPARHGAATTIAIAIVAGSTVFGLFIAAITFGALAIAFPIAVPIAEHYRVAVSPTDVMIAEQLGAFWWVFAGLSIASLFAAAAVAIKTVTHFETNPVV